MSHPPPNFLLPLCVLEPPTNTYQLLKTEGRVGPIAPVGSGLGFQPRVH